MPTRTINLKMVLGKKNDRAELRQALWTTHREVNHAVAKIEKMLLLCRGCEYRTIGPDGEEVVVIIYGPVRGNAFYDCSAFKTLNLARQIYPEFGFLSSVSCDIKPLNKSSGL